MEEAVFIQVDKPTDRKLRYEGFCQKCDKVTPHRYHGGSLYMDFFRCMKCKSVNRGKFMETEKEFTDSESSTVRRVKYHEQTHVLEIEFATGGIYEYYEVPASRVMALFKSEKVGSFVATEIKGKYNYKKI